MKRDIEPPAVNKFQTVQSVFDIAINLMDEQNESTGSTSTADTKVYVLRTPALVNALLDYCYKYSDTLAYPEDGKRPICRKVEGMADEIDLDEYLCTGILPYGLAGQLLSEENPQLANFFWQTFLERLRDAANSMPAVESGVVDCYGIVDNPHGQYGDW